MKGFKHIVQLLTVVSAVSCMQSCTSTSANNSIQPSVDEEGKPFFEKKEDLVTYVNFSEETVRKREMGEFEFELKQFTPDMLALQELGGNVSDTTMYREALSHYSDLLYFKLTINKPGYQKELLTYNLESAQQYSERVKYCSFEINRDLYLLSGSDSIPCAIHEFERTFKLNAGLNFMVSFTKPATANEFTVVYNDRLFKNGYIKFHYARSSAKLPYLKIK